jgi:hypothetical protein
MWREGGRNRLLIVVSAFSAIAILILFLASIGLIVLDWRVRMMWAQNQRMERSITENTRSIISNQVNIKDTEDRIIKEANQRWLTFQDGHPQFSVPIVNPNDRQIDVVAPLATPSPTAIPPKVITKTIRRTVIIRRSAPTPKPWWSRH